MGAWEQRTAVPARGAPRRPKLPAGDPENAKQAYYVQALQQHLSVSRLDVKPPPKVLVHPNLSGDVLPLAVTRGLPQQDFWQ